MSTPDETNKKKILQIVKDHSPSSFVMELWDASLSELSEELRGYVLRVLEDDTSSYERLTKDLEEKFEVLNSGNMERWEEIMRTEAGALKANG